VALNFWLDLQRLANQGARSAAVNCGSGSNQCGSTTLEEFLGPRTTSTPEGQIVSSGNTPDPDDIQVCYVPPSPLPAGWLPDAGDAVRVSLKEKYRLQAIVGLAKIDLSAKATMRLEQRPDSPALPDRLNQDNWVLAAHTGTDRCQV
jgi:hypothetical protein